MKALKKTMLGAAALAAIATMAMASPAAAGIFYKYPTLHNANGTEPVTIGSVSWSGSYLQIPTPIAAGDTKGGTYHTVLDYGYGSVTFRAYPITGDTANYCYMTFSVSNTTGAESAVAAIAQGPNWSTVHCSVSGLDFEAWGDDQ